MQHDNERASGADCPADTGRRQALSFLACLPAIMALRSPIAVSPAFDDAINFLASRLAAASMAMAEAEPREQSAHLRRIIAYAQAMAVIPARGQSAIEAKMHAAQWSLDLGPHSLRLASELADQLMASAEDDQNKSRAPHSFRTV